MIQDVDRTLKRLLRDRVPLPREEINFDTPNESFRTRLSRAGGVTINLYLYDLRENHNLRSREWRRERQPNGQLVKQRPTVRMDLSYLITVWSPEEPPEVLAEHRVLSRILETLLRYPTLPSELLQGQLVGQDPPLPTLVAQPDGMRNPTEFWGAMRQSPRPSIQLVVTVGIQPTAVTDEPLVLHPIVSRAVEFGLKEGKTYSIHLRPSLPGDASADRVIRRIEVEAVPSAQLQQAIFASRYLIQVNEAERLNTNDWVFIADTNSEFVRLGHVSGSGIQSLSLTIPLQFPHSPLTATTIRLNDTAVATLKRGDWIWIQGNTGQEDDQADVVQITGTGSLVANTDIPIRPALSHDHTDSNREIRQATFNTVGALSASVGKEATAIRLDAAAAALLSQENWIWIQGNAGWEDDQAEVVQLTEPVVANTDITIRPALSHDHTDSNREIRQATFNTVGSLLAVVNPILRVKAPESDLVETRLAEPVGSGDTNLQVFQRDNDTVISAGDVLLISDGNQSEVVQVASVTTDSSDIDSIELQQALRFVHQAERNIYKRSLEGATQLGQPAAQPGSPIVLNQDVSAGVALMVGAGKTGEFCRLSVDAGAGNLVDVSPPLRNNHPSNTPLRQLTTAGILGRLQIGVLAGDEQIQMVGTPVAVKEARRRGRPLISAGDFLQLDDSGQYSAFQVTAVTETETALGSVPQSLISIGGEVIDNATPPNQIVGAQVTLVELGLTDTTNAEGQFTFTNLWTETTHTLRVIASGYQQAEQTVQVPARNTNEYQITLNL